jgi:hypothetical protein
MILPLTIAIVVGNNAHYKRVNHVVNPSEKVAFYGKLKNLETAVAALWNLVPGEGKELVDRTLSGYFALTGLKTQFIDLPLVEFNRLTTDFYPRLIPCLSRRFQRRRV